jgi:tellurite methyltransferase
MERTIDGFHQDEVGDWVAELACGHDQHVRHRPPFLERGWVLEEAGRSARLGRPLDCPLCDRAELPERLRATRTGPRWNARSMPAGLRRRHRLGPRTWALLVVDAGTLRYRADVTPAMDLVLGTGAVQAVPPEADHEVTLLDEGEFHLEFFVVDRAVPGDPGNGRRRSGGEAGGDPACWAGDVCAECGAIGGHRSGCGGEPGGAEGAGAPPGAGHGSRP